LIKGSEKNDLRTKIKREDIEGLGRNLHNVLWGGGGTNDSEIFYSLVNIILAKIQDEYEKENNQEYDFQVHQYGDNIESPEKIYEISHNASDDNRIFTPIDIFVPVAVHLYKGNDTKLIGKQIKSIKEVVFPKPNYNEAQKMIAGEIVYIDHFGNAVSNISKEIFEKHLSGNQNFTVKFRECSMKNIVKKHTDIITDWEKENLFLAKELALFNEADLLEIAMYKGSKTNGAAPLMGLNIGEKIYIEFS